jgi:uncharacterized protein
MTMQTVRVLNTTKGTVLGGRVGVADTSLSRMVGLLGRRSMEAGTGLLIMPSQAVHTIGMHFPIDLVFVDKRFRVIHVQRSLVPYRLSGLHWRASCVLELPTGTIAETRTSIGDELLIEE